MRCVSAGVGVVTEPEVLTPRLLVPGQVVTGPAEGSKGETMVAFWLEYFVDQEVNSGVATEPEYAPFTK